MVLNFTNRGRFDILGDRFGFVQLGRKNEIIFDLVERA